jgi:hypothetical protein
MKHEIRNFQLRASANNKFQLRGRAVTYNSLSSPITNFRERIAPGAFALHLSTKPDVRALFNHDPNRVLGRTQNGTLKLIDGDDGLDFVCQLDPENTEHRNLYSSVKRGDIDGCSFAFAVDGDGQEFDAATDENGQRFNRRTIKRAKIFDISAVTNPAYPAATSVSARADVPVKRCVPTAVVFRSVPKGVCLEDFRDTAELISLRARLQKQGQVIAASTPKKLSAEEQLEIVNERRRCFPWESQ